MSAALGIFRLQQVDRQIERARARLEHIRKTLENDAEIQKAAERLENAQKEYRRIRQKLKNAEAEASAQKSKLQQAEASLYGGQIKNPKELQEIEKEIASLKKFLDVLEERQLEAMLEAETAENELAQAGKALEGLQSRVGAEHKKLLEEKSALDGELERLAEERQAALAPIENHLLETYETLRRQKNGVAVTEVVENACASCGALINAAAQQNARSQKQLVKCPTCGRILFVH